VTAPRVVRLKLGALALAACLPAFAADQGVAKGQSFGNPASPILIELYSDFECPGCAAFHNQFLPELMRSYVETGRAYLVIHDLSFHTHSPEATGYALAAVRIGKYREVADALYRHQVEWSASGKAWDTVAAVLSPADQKKVEKLAKDPAVIAEVKAETDQGRAKIQRTPTMLVTHAMKQRRFEGTPPWDIFRDWVDHDLLKK
jgi:protein-disulfide isomerase